MIGYDWVDEYNGKDVRVRGAFTEQDVVVLEGIFFRCAFGDDADARAAATVTNQSLSLDPGELCADLRRLQLQVQTNSAGKGKMPMLLAIRESPNLFQLLSSGVVEALPDALVRAESHLPPAQRPLALDWTRFLGVMGLCLKSAWAGTGLLAPSAVAELFEEKPDDRLDFLTRRRARLPPPRKAAATEPTKARNNTNKAHRGLSGLGVAGVWEGGPGVVVGTSGTATGGEGFACAATTAAAAAAAGAAESNSAEDASVREAGSSVDLGDGGPFESSAYGGDGGGSCSSRRRKGTPATTAGKNSEQADGGRERGAERRGGSAAALKSLLRPQLRHEVFRGYGEAVSRRRDRQREALRRAANPDVEPTRAYKSCGLCQALFPVDSLGSTVSLKVLGGFLAKAGVPSERFERKASRLCALHRLPLCVFCSQFFDPDFPGGIVPPGGYSERPPGGCGGGLGGGRRRRGKRRDGGMDNCLSSCCWSSAPSSMGSPSRLGAPSREGGPAVAMRLLGFFDDRFPDRFSETPLPSSAPAAARSSASRSSPSLLAVTAAAATPRLGQASPASSFMGLPYRNGQEGAFRLELASEAHRDYGGDCSKGRNRRHVREAMELREVGRLVRRGYSIRDRLAAPR